MSMEQSETKTIITGLLTSNPLRCTIQQLCNDFRQMVGCNLPNRKFGYATAEDYLRSIPDTVLIIGSGPSAEVKGIVKEKSAHINNMVVKQKKDGIPAHKRKNLKKVENNFYVKGGISNGTNSCNVKVFECGNEYKSKIPKNVQNNLRKLIMTFPNGIWCRKLPLEYCKMFEEPLNFERYGYRSVIEMCSDLQEILHYVQPSSDDFLLFDKNVAVPSYSQNDKNVKKEENCIDWSLGSALIPADITQFLYEIDRLSLDDMKIGDWLMELKVGTIYDVRSFWIHSKGGQLQKLHTELQDFKLYRNRYEIPTLFLVKGLYCVVFHQSNYHRSIICKVLPEEESSLEVLLIDYGNVIKTCIKNVWYLPKEFSNIPCQAIKARLSHVRSLPYENTDAINKFKELTENAELVGEVMNINKKDLVVDLYLSNVTDEDHIFYINDILVEKGCAEYI